MKSKVKLAKKHYFTHTLPNFLKSSPKKFWGYLNPKDNKLSFGTEKDILNTATRLNNYFQSVFTTDNGSLPNLEPFSSTDRLKPLIITEAGVLTLLLNLDVKKGVGPDNIPNIFLKSYSQ